MNLIAAVDNNWGIGRGGELLFFIPEDMRRFKRLTENKVVIMGSATLKSLPGSKPLKNRVNIILSRNTDFAAENALVCGSTERLFEAIRDYGADDVFVIGGESVYALLAEYCSRAYITRVDAVCENADRFFPNIEKSGWVLASRSAVMEHDGLRYMYEEWENRATTPPPPPLSPTRFAG